MDTLAISEELIAAGVPEPQAKAIAKTQVAAAKESQEGLATKSDIADLRADNAKLRQEMADRDAVSAWRTSGLIVAMTGIFSIIVKLL